ncbi:hypothetical protein FV226_13185 [Methylobacterium sp. WL12]|uniref:hypothetical protein n=1 Tax=Methylobacterium sp. WL12 TaxID=2603890 RepID=UPI0011CC30AE|nr:hypothetical protein [Methylobacterium sp. WL12]TXM72177.1 hypothetical protein FV226_13185 [Methylobacterium sp. WL12]
MEQDNGYPSGEVIQEFLAAVHQALFEGTGMRFKLELDTEHHVLKVTRLCDGYHCAIHVPPLRDPAFTRTEFRIGGDDVPRDERLKAAMLIRMHDAAAQIVRSCQVGAEGVAPKSSAKSLWWENSRGRTIATLMGGGITVHDGDTLNGLVSPNHLSFYVGDRRVLQVLKHLVGPVPDERLLTGLWEVFNDGFTAGRRAGTK